MGVWGNKLYQNDIALDVKDSYKELLQDGKTNEEAYNEMISSNMELLSSKYNDEKVMFILSFADTLWNYGRLTEKYKETCLTLIEECKKDKLKNKENSYCIYSISELEKLENKLKSEQPKEKKIRKIIPYICDWKDYDTFAYKLESDYAKEKGLYGRYLIIIKIDVTKTYPKCMSPVVWVKITKDDKIPKTIEEIDELEFVQLWSYQIKSNLPKFSKNGKILFDNYGYMPVYRATMLTTSKRMLPNKMIYIGNFRNIISPQYENIFDNKYFCELLLLWKDFENEIIEKYFDYNKRELRIYTEEYIKNELPILEKMNKEWKI